LVSGSPVKLIIIEKKPTVLCWDAGGREKGEMGREFFDLRLFTRLKKWDLGLHRPD